MLQSCRKSRLDDITGDDLLEFKVFLRKYRTSIGKAYDDRSIYNHFLNVVSFLNEHGKGNLVRQSDWPRYEKKKTVCYDETDMARLLQFADEDEADVLEFFLGVGFRNGEGTHVEWGDIDLKNREIKTYSKRSQYGWEVKDSEQRIIGISDRPRRAATCPAPAASRQRAGIPEHKREPGQAPAPNNKESRA